MSRWKSIAANIGLSLISIIVCILLLEWFLRFSNIQRLFPLNPPIFRTSDDAEISYELIPSVSRTAYASTVTTNAQGFRSPELDRGKPLIAMIGDSVTFGQGVDDHQTIAEYLQQRLPNYEILNAGVGGYNIEQEAAQFRRHIKALNPRVVILTFSFNDFDETMALDEEGYLYPRSRKPTQSFKERLEASINKPGTLPIPFKAFLQTNSAVFNFIERATKGLAFRSHAPTESIFEDTVTDAQVQRYAIHLQRLSQDIGEAKKLFVMWPEQNLHMKSRAALTAMAQREGFTVIDLYEIYGNYYESLGWDGHPSARTNARTAAILAEALEVFGMTEK